MEWLILLLVPAAVLAVLASLGFAGCQFFFKAEPDPDLRDVDPPTDVEATGISISSIRVSWKNPNPGDIRYRVERVKQFETAIVPIETAALTIEDVNLAEGTTYFYSVFAIRVSDSEESVVSETVQATTLAFVRAFETNLTITQLDLQGFCLIQRLEPLSLEASGGLVRLTLHGPSIGSLTIDRITISRALNPPAGDLYDAAETPTTVATGVVVAQDAFVTLPPIVYTLDRGLPLLVAFDINPTPGQGNVRRRPAVQSDEASMFFRAASADALEPDRVPNAANPIDQYSPTDSIYIVRKIEVAPNAP
jgi:hypothetical protein